MHSLHVVLMFLLCDNRLCQVPNHLIFAKFVTW